MNPEGIGLHAVDGGDSLEERLDGGLAEEDPGLALHHRLQRPSASERQDRTPRGLCLHGRDPAVLRARQHEETRAGVEAWQLGVADASEKTDRGTRGLREAIPR